MRTRRSIYKSPITEEINSSFNKNKQTSKKIQNSVKNNKTGRNAKLKSQNITKEEKIDGIEQCYVKLEKNFIDQSPIKTELRSKHKIIDNEDSRISAKCFTETIDDSINIDSPKYKEKTVNQSNSSKRNIKCLIDDETVNEEACEENKDHNIKESSVVKKNRMIKRKNVIDTTELPIRTLRSNRNKTVTSEISLHKSNKPVKEKNETYNIKESDKQTDSQLNSDELRECDKNLNKKEKSYNTRKENDTDDLENISTSVSSTNEKITRNRKHKYNEKISEEVNNFCNEININETGQSNTLEVNVINFKQHMKNKTDSNNISMNFTEENPNVEKNIYNNELIKVSGDFLEKNETIKLETSDDQSSDISDIENEKNDDNLLLDKSINTSEIPLIEKNDDMHIKLLSKNEIENIVSENNLDIKSVTSIYQNLNENDMINEDHIEKNDKLLNCNKENSDLSDKIETVDSISNMKITENTIMSSDESNDSDSSPDEITFQNSRNEALHSLKTTSSELKKTKFEMKKFRQKYHERNILQKKEKEKKILETESKKLPSEILENLPKSFKKKEVNKHVKSLKQNFTDFPKEMSSKQSSNQKQEEFISIHGNTEFKAYKLNKRPMPISEVALEFKRTALYGKKNKREPVKEIMNKRIKQMVAGNL